MDKKIESAIRESVQKEEQSDALAKLFIAWFESASKGDKGIDGAGMLETRLAAIYDEAKLSSSEERSD